MESVRKGHDHSGRHSVTHPLRGDCRRPFGQDGNARVAIEVLNMVSTTAELEF